LLPLPGLIWFYEVLVSGQQRRLTKSMVFAIKNEVLSMEDPLYHAPFPNCGVSSGICWGSSTPPVPSVKSLQSVMPRFFSQAFNGDLSGNRLNNFKMVDSDGDEYTADNAYDHIVKLIDEYKKDPEKFVYPYDDLKAAGSTVHSMAAHYLPNLAK
jgi:hypothetical protein